MLESSNLLFQIHSTFSLIREGRCSRVNDVEGNLQAPKNKLEMLARGLVVLVVGVTETDVKVINIFCFRFRNPSRMG